MSGWVNGDFSSAEQRPFLLPPPSSGSSPKEETHSHARDKLLLSNQDLEEPWQGSPLCESFEKGDVLTTFFFLPISISPQSLLAGSNVQHEPFFFLLLLIPIGVSPGLPQGFVAQDERASWHCSSVSLSESQGLC